MENLTRKDLDFLIRLLMREIKRREDKGKDIQRPYTIRRKLLEIWRDRQ